MEVESAIQRAPDELRRVRDGLAVAEERLASERAHALLDVVEDSAGGKLTVAERDARVHLRVREAREAFAVAQSAYEYARDLTRALDREKDSLQTRSANLRAEMSLAGKSGA